MNLIANPFSTVLHRTPATQMRTLRALCSPEQIQAALELERLRADRSGGTVSSVIFEAGDDPQTEQNKHARTLQVAALVLRESRATDAVGTLLRGEERICAVLSDTAVGGADCFVDRVRALALPWGIDVRATVYCYPTDEPNDDTHHGQHRSVRKQLCPPTRLGLATRESGLAHNLQSTTPHPTCVETTSTAFAFHNWAALSRQSVTPAQDDVTALRPSVVPARSKACLPLAELSGYRMPLWKRVFDIVGAIVGLILFSPVMLIAAAMIRLSSSGPVIFTQRRSGWRGREFTIYKFRTMTNDAEQRKSSLRQFSEQDGPAFKMTNDPRVTLIGRFLRATSLDELPQFWNVLIGNMSLVGPRPLPVDEANACSQWQRRRLDVVPGLTCIWQVRGRSSVAFDDWMRMDMEYIDHRSPLGDLSLLLLTIPAVALRKGAH